MLTQVIPKLGVKTQDCSQFKGSPVFIKVLVNQGYPVRPCLKNQLPLVTPKTRHRSYQGFWSQLSFLDQVGKLIIIKRRGPRRMLSARMNQLQQRSHLQSVERRAVTLGLPTLPKFVSALHSKFSPISRPKLYEALLSLFCSLSLSKYTSGQSQNEAGVTA